LDLLCGKGAAGQNVASGCTFLSLQKEAGFNLTRVFFPEKVHFSDRFLSGIVKEYQEVLSKK